MQLEWDEKKRAANLAKHGLDFTDAERFDWLTAYITPARIIAGEERSQAFNIFDGALHVVTFVPRGEAIRIISFRCASRQERKRYGTPKP